MTENHRQSRESNRDLEPSGATMRAWVSTAMDRIVSHIESLPDQPAGYLENVDALAAGLVEPLPEEGRELDDLLDLVFGRGVEHSFNTAGPGYLAYIPGGGIFHAALADLIANSINRYVGVWLAAPLLVRLEMNVIGWFCEMVGFPGSARGLLTSGGSMANFTAIATARSVRLPGGFLGASIYVGDQIHHSVLKAAVLAGFPSENVISIPSDDSYRISPGALREAVAADRAAGREPFMVVASAGTTNTGAVDELDALADICEEFELWFHVDAAYGGFFMLTERGRRAMSGIQRSDSVTLDPHKGLFLPYGTGAVLVRNGDALRKAHGSGAEYLPPLQEEDEDLPGMDFCENSMELSRDFRGLRVWLPIKMHGIGPFRENLDEKLDLASWIAEELGNIPGIEVVAQPQLTISAFRLVFPGMDVEELNALNRQLLTAILERRRVWLTSTMLNGVFVIRICVLSFRTHRDRMEECLRIISDSVEELTET